MDLCWICGLCQFSFADITQTLPLVVDNYTVVAIIFYNSELLPAGELDNIVSQILDIEIVFQLLRIKVSRFNGWDSFIAGGHFSARRVH